MAHVQPISIQRKRPLDPNPYSQLQQPRLYLAYTQCLQQEQNSAHNAEGLMYSRLLGYLMLESLGDESRDYVCEEIIGCNGSADLMTRLAKLYKEYLLRLCESMPLLWYVLALLFRLSQFDRTKAVRPHPRSILAPLRLKRKGSSIPL